MAVVHTLKKILRRWSHQQQYHMTAVTAHACTAGPTPPKNWKR